MSAIQYSLLDEMGQLERIRNAYQIGDAYRQAGEYSYSFGYEGDQFERLLSECLCEITSEQTGHEDKLYYLNRAYEATAQYYPHFLCLLDGAEEPCL